MEPATPDTIGQNFSKACGIQFQNAQGVKEFGWTTSWEVTTRLVGSVIMTHSDDNELILLPPYCCSTPCNHPHRA